jgi:drug/metabolite transporter (DMT)-like permease
MTFVGGSVGVSHELVRAPLFFAQALRYGVAAVLLVLLGRARHVRVVRPRGREWLWLGGLAASGLVLFNVAVVRGVAHAEPAAIAVAVACVPVILGVFGPLLEGARPRRQLLVAAVVVTLGAALVEGVGRADAIGIAWAAVALLCEAGFTLLAIPLLPRHGADGVAFHSVWLASAMLAALALCTERVTAAFSFDAAQWAAIAYLAVCVTAAAFVLWYSAVRGLGAATAGLLTGVAPVAAAVSGTLTGATAPTAGVWAGIALVGVGLAGGLRNGRRVGTTGGRGRTRYSAAAPAE